MGRPVSRRKSPAQVGAPQQPTWPMTGQGISPGVSSGTERMALVTSIRKPLRKLKWGGEGRLVVGPLSSPPHLHRTSTK